MLASCARKYNSDRNICFHHALVRAILLKENFYTKGNSSLFISQMSVIRLIEETWLHWQHRNEFFFTEWIYNNYYYYILLNKIDTNIWIDTNNKIDTND